MIGLKSNNLIIIFFILILYFANIFISIDINKKNILPSPVELNVLATSIAITEIESNSNSYAGNQNVFLNITNTKEYKKFLSCIEDCSLTNLNIQDAVEIAKKDKKFKKIYYEREDLGLIDYYKFALLTFGYDISSYTFLYLTLLGISLVVFILNFKKELSYLTIILSFLFAHFFFVNLLPSYSNELAVVHSRRFLSILSIIPTIHIILLIFRREILVNKEHFYIFLQTLILVLAIHFRSAALYQIFLIIFCIFIKLIKDKLNWKFYLNINIPITFVTITIGIIFIFLKIYTFLIIDTNYSSRKTGHLFWHVVHIGLASHPDAKEKYNIFKSDIPSFSYIEKVSQSNYGNKNWQSYYSYDDFENLLKKRVFNIFKDDTLFFISSYYYKISDFLKIFFEEIVNKNKITIFILFLLTVLSGLFVNLKSNRKEFFHNTSVLFLLITFSSAPWILIFPVKTYIFETSLLIFSLIIYIIISIINIYKNYLFKKDYLNVSKK